MNRLAKRLARITEEIAGSDSGFLKFKDSFISNILENDQINSDTLYKLIGHQLGGDWAVYGEQGKDFLCMNVKWYGGGSFSKFNKDGRAEGKEMNYFDEIRNRVESFYNEWNYEFESRFKFRLHVFGRSGGYWGVDVLDYHNFYDVFSIDENAISNLYAEMKKEYPDEDNPDELGYLASLRMTYGGDVADYIQFSSGFVSFLNEFEKSVKDTSAEWETQEWNDDLFDFMSEEGLI